MYHGGDAGSRQQGVQLGSPGEAASLLQTGGGEEKAAGPCARGCWLGAVGFLIALALGTIAALLVVESGRLHLPLLRSRELLGQRLGDAIWIGSKDPASPAPARSAVLKSFANATTTNEPAEDAEDEGDSDEAEEAVKASSNETTNAMHNATSNRQAEGSKSVNASTACNTCDSSNTCNTTTPCPTTSTSMGPLPPKPAPPAEDGCDVEDELPYIAPHSGGETAVSIKVLSYNLYWWNLYGVHKGTFDGTDDSAAHLIEDSGKSKPYDLMGFQECEDIDRVLEPAGLQGQYFSFGGSGKSQSVCITARNASFKLLSHGIQVIAEDTNDEYYGKRVAQWMRLKHWSSGQHVFFMNLHGPLPLNTGGVCGGNVTAHKVLQLIAAEADRGDAVILVGDFNSGDDSPVIERLGDSLHRLYHGLAVNGIDNFFSNIDSTWLLNAETLGTGGSDHDALSIELQVGGEAPADPWTPAPPPPVTPGDLERPEECGMKDEGSMEFPDLEGEEQKEVQIPKDCCSRCSENKACKSWTWREDETGGNCWMWHSEPTRKEGKAGSVSGMPKK